MPVIVCPTCHAQIEVEEGTNLTHCKFCRMPLNVVPQVAQPPRPKPGELEQMFNNIAAKNDDRAFIAFLDNLKAEDVKDVDKFYPAILAAMNRRTALCVGRLLTRLYAGGLLARFVDRREAYETRLMEIDPFVYDYTQPRDVFIAHASVDFEQSEALVEALEREGFSCFIDSRNIKKGKGSREDYRADLYTAIKNCTIFLFVSSEASRRAECYACANELQYVWESDVKNAPPCFGNVDYRDIPSEYKKQRVQFVLDTRDIDANRKVGSFFDHCQRCLSIEDAVERVKALREASRNECRRSVIEAIGD